MSIKIVIALAIGLTIGYFVGSTSQNRWKGSYIGYCVDYKTCVNSKNNDIAQFCGVETQLKYPELFVK